MAETETTKQGGVTRSRGVVSRVRSLRNWITTGLRAVAFWLAILLPVVYLPLLFVETAWTISLVSVLLVSHIVAVFAGADYDPNS